MDKEYFSKNEDICYQKLLDFNAKTNYFTNIERQPPKSEIDAVATGINRMVYSIELKNREKYQLKEDNKNNYLITNNSFSGDTIFIENHKITSLLLDMVYNHRLPLYINFFDNGYTTIHNLITLKNKPEQTREMKIQSKGYQQMEICKRYLLPIEESAIFDEKHNLKKSTMKDAE